MEREFNLSIFFFLCYVCIACSTPGNTFAEVELNEREKCIHYLVKGVYTHSNERSPDKFAMQLCQGFDTLEMIRRMNLR